MNLDFEMFMKAYVCLRDPGVTLSLNLNSGSSSWVAMVKQLSLLAFFNFVLEWS